MSAGNAETLRRLQYRVQHHGDAPSAATSSSPTAPAFSNLPPPVMNGHVQQPNGWSSASQFGLLHQQQQQPPRTLLQQSIAYRS